VKRQPLIGFHREPRAVYSPCEKYRYFLAWPTAVDNDRAALGVFANPSTATHMKTDRTVDRWIDYCGRWGYGWAWVCNVRAWRETNPKLVPPDPLAIGPSNSDEICRAALRAELVVCGWGKLGGCAVAAALAAIRTAGKTPHALKLNKDGSPAHPLYLRTTLTPFPMAVSP
jgi:hypothetical protein